jgi:hypothetical protein
MKRNVTLQLDAELLKHARALARLRVRMNLGWKRPGSRDELHER